MRRWVTGCLLAALLLASFRVPAPQPDWDAILCAPLPWPGACPGHWLGTDELGRDTLGLVVIGLRSSVLLASAALIVGLLLGGLLGLLLGAVGRGLDAWLARLLDLFAALPLMLVALIAVGLLGRSPLSLILALTVAAAIPTARIARAEVCSVLADPALQLARWQGLGFVHRAIHHLGPALWRAAGPVAALLWPQLLLAEGMLGFLGLSLRDPAVTLGTLLAEGSTRVATAPWGVLVATFALFLLVFTLRRRS